MASKRCRSSAAAPDSRDRPIIAPVLGAVKKNHVHTLDSGRWPQSSDFALGSDGRLFEWRARGSAPELPVQHAVVYRLVDVLGQNLGLAVEIGDGAGHAKHLVVRAGREAEFLNVRPQQVHAGIG